MMPFLASLISGTNYSFIVLSYLFLISYVNRINDVTHLMVTKVITLMFTLSSTPSVGAELFT